MTRLLLLSSEFPPGPGGIGTHASQLAASLVGAGWRVRVLTIQDYAGQEEIEAYNQAQPFEIERWIRPKNRLVDVWGRLRHLRQAIQNWKPNVLVATGEKPVWLAASVQHALRWSSSTQCHLPWCAVWHGFRPPHPAERQITRWAYQQPDLTIAVSQYSLARLQGLGARPGRSVVITNGADAKSYYPDHAAGIRLRRELGLEGVPLLLTVGHVSDRKGQDIIIRALPEILKIVPDVHYLVAGLPSRQQAFEQLTGDLGVARNVHFLGRLADKELLAAYNACDVFVLTSRHSSDGEYEGYGIVVVEAALCGKPSVVAGNSGLVEAIRDGQTGLVVPENDAAATAAALLKLLQDPGLRLQMGKQARSRALEEQTWDACMDRYQQVLYRLIDIGAREKAWTS